MTRPPQPLPGPAEAAFPLSSSAGRPEALCGLQALRLEMEALCHLFASLGCHGAAPAAALSPALPPAAGRLL